LALLSLARGLDPRFLGRPQSPEEPHGKSARRHSRPPDLGDRDGRQHLALQDDGVRRERASDRRRRGARSTRDRLRGARQLQPVPLDLLHRRLRRGGIATIPGAVFGGIFIQFVPNIANEISDAAPWAIYGLFLLGFMYLMPKGIAGTLGEGLRRLASARAANAEAARDPAQ